MHCIAIGTFLVLCMAYFYPQLQGKEIPQGDITQYRATAKEIHDYYEETGEVALWTNSMFAGMPSYQVSMRTPGNKTKVVEKVFNLFLKRPIGYFLAMMIGFYLMCIAFGMSPLTSLLGSIAFGLTVNHFVLFETGHTSKLRAFAFFGVIVAGMINAYRGKYLFGATLFALGLALEIGVNHIQMTYYLFLCLLVYLGFILYRDIKANNIQNFVKASAFLLVGAFLAIGANASRLWTTYEYSKDTIRGEPILTTSTPNESSSSEVEGLAWDYAMGWSNGTMDLFTYLIPGVVGGGSREPISGSSAFAQITNQTQAGTVDAPMYWGDLPFTSGPSYVGAIILFLFILGAIVVRGDMRWWLISTTILTLLLSMGKNLEFFNRLFFEYFPLYNKFRTPNSIMSITEFLMVLMGTWTLSEIVRGKVDREKLRKGMLYAGGITIGLCLFFLLLGPSIFSFTSAGDARYDPRLVDALVSDRKSLMRMDALRSMAFIGLGFGLLHYYLKGKIRQSWMLVGMALLVTIDVWGVGRRYLDSDNFVTPGRTEVAFTPRQPDQVIMKDSDIHFRVFDMTADIDKNAIPSYHHKSIGGYHAAKLQRYQDLIDKYIIAGHMPVLNMLNTKYFIDQQGQLQVNTQAFGNAWFVSSLQEVGSPDEEFNALQTIDPATTAVYHQDYSDYVGDFNPQVSGTISLTEYSPNKLTYESTGNTEQFAVFSEIWYGPNKGWHAYIDGEEVPFIRVDYALRGLRVPQGAHTIVFEFTPRSFYVGEKISTISSILILLTVVLLIVNYFKPLRPLLQSKNSGQTATA